MSRFARPRNRRSARIQARVADRLRDQIENIAYRDDCDISDVVRIALAEFVAREEAREKEAAS